ncbi:Hypothetical predicted protein, partial [Paramuricea clavata]
MDYIRDSNVDLCAITETWLTPDDAAVRAELCPNGFKFLDNPRTGRRGGGIGLLYRDSLQVKTINSGEKSSFEFSECIVTSSSSRDLRVVNIYRPPYSGEHNVTTSVFFTEFANYIEAFLLCKEQLIITGDFNIHIDSPEQPDARTFLDLLDSFGLKQNVMQPTHISGHTLVLLITRISEDIIKDPPVVDRFISDHASILCNLQQAKPALTIVSRIYRKIKSVNLASLEADLAERKWRRSKSVVDFTHFKQKRNQVTYIMNQARRKFYADFIEENRAEQGQLFKAAKKLLGKKEELSFPDHFEKVSLATDIGRFFVRKIGNIRSDINAVQFDFDVVPKDLVLNETQTFGDFQQLTEEDVTALVQKSGKKSCALDPMPTGLVVKCLGTLLPVLTRIINLSLASGKFSEEWKEALVVPLLKHQGLNLEFCNLRPISNLQYVSKLIERAVFEQMNNHMMQFGLYPVLQSAYRKGHSTETILLKIQNDILLNMDKQNVTLLVFLDLSAAFDTVDHDILISRLQSSFGIKGNVLNWFSSYLSNRTQRVTLSGCVSDSFSLEQGIPQGSCLGPLLFTIYA